MSTMIKNVHLLTMNENMDEYINGYLIFEDDTIIEVGEGQKQGFTGQVIDGKNGILMPGMINTHTHIGMIPFRSLGDDCKDRLRRFLFPLENMCMTSKLAKASAQYAISEMLLSGITCMADMYYFEKDLMECCDQMGMRGLLGETIIDFKTCDTTKPFEGLEIGKDLVLNAHSNLCQAMLAPHATNTNTADILKECHEFCVKHNCMWMMHVAEMDYEMQYFKDQFGLSPVAYLEKIGVLSYHLIMAHAIHLDDHDLDLLAKYNVSVAHCIGANTKAAKGVARVKDMLNRNIRVGLGTDGPSSSNTLDLFTQMRMVANFHKTYLKDRSAFPAKDIVYLATMGGAKTLGLDHLVGSLEVGKKADLVLIDTLAVQMFPIHDAYSALVYSANPSVVDTVFVNGKKLVENKQLVEVDLQFIRQNLANEMTYFNEMAKKQSDEMIA